MGGVRAFEEARIGQTRLKKKYKEEMNKKLIDHNVLCAQDVRENGSHFLASNLICERVELKTPPAALNTFESNAFQMDCISNGIFKIYLKILKV